jgi:hypothetical protein
MIDALIKRVSVTYKLQANNLTSLSPYATDLTSDR